MNNRGEQNPLFDDVNKDDDDEEYLDDLYECPYCGYYQKIENWPFKCESCDKQLEESECTEVNGLSEIEQDKNQILRIKMIAVAESEEDAGITEE